ncbi:MAG: hypothetical protein WD773_04790 [Gemmatimonadales bacterium]
MRIRLIVALSVLVARPAGVAQAQTVAFTRLETIGNDTDDRTRLAQLFGQRTTGAYLLRSASSMTPGLMGEPRRVRWALFAPELMTVGNSSITFSLNDGALWAGRGWSLALRTGVRVEVGRLSVTLAPELLGSENIPYDLAPPEVTLARPSGRSLYSSPWHIRPFSIDLPQRFGDPPLRAVDLGQSTLAVDAGPVTVGLSSENEWWGPGIRNAIVLSNNAAGIPRLFLRTSRPLATPLGTVAARWFAGGLTESRFFDRDPANDLRSIAGVGIAWTPRWEPDLTVGFARAVYAPVSGWGRVPLRLFDVLRDFGRPTNAPPGDSLQIPGRDQVYSLFARWVFPADGFAVHAEWARTEFPASLRDLLTHPNHTQGYTLGLEWARPVRRQRDAVRVQAEVTYLEMSPSYRNRPVSTFYTSRRAVQGYTQRGQVIGAAIGPGASSQWLAVDYVAPRWRVGLFGGRVRWEDDALYFFPNTAISLNKWCSHDVSLLGGVSLGGETRWGRVHMTLTRSERLNTFFYHLTQCGLVDPQLVRDVPNTTLQLRFSPP